jgi:hypothetical protein
MLKFLGHGMVCLGLLMVLIPFLEWLGIGIRRRAVRDSTKGEKKTIWDLLLAFLEKAGWVATAGLILIYLGLKALGLSGI